MATKKKSGAPDPKFFESSDTISKFDPVRQWLIKNFKKVSEKQLKYPLTSFLAENNAYLHTRFNNQSSTLNYFNYCPPTVHPRRAPKQQELGYSLLQHAAVPRGMEHAL